MATISEIQKKLKQFNQYAKELPNSTSYQKRWKELFNMPLSSQSAHSFATYYRDMRSNSRGSRNSRKNHRKHASRKQRGGAAPLDYVTAPGLNIQAYARFPVEAGTDPASVRNLDVYFKDSLTADCGVKDSSLQVPANMGSNQVGGRRRRRTMRRRGRNIIHSRKFRQRGGDLLESITARVPFVHNSSVSPNMLQSAQNAYAGGTQAIPAPADPAAHTWEPRTHGIAGLINPGIVAYVPNDVGKLSNPAPWMTSS